VTVLLKPFELAYRGINRMRRALYRARLLEGKRLGKPVISIGNLAAGGTGKTPAVIAVCRFLEERGLRVAVLTRGYGRAGTVDGPVTTLDSDKFGDEPVLIKRSTKANVIVGTKRYENARNIDADVFVLDDGFQHLQLHRDLDIVIDAPSRFLREGRSALKDADIVIPRRLRLAIPDIEGPVFAFSGLADNEQFFRSLREAGLHVAGSRGFPDHHRYTPADLEALRRDAGGARLVTTGKDVVKIDDPSITAIPAEFVIEPAVLEQIAEVATAPPGRKKKRRKGRLQTRLEYALYQAVAGRVSAMSEEAAHRWGTRVGNLARRVLGRRDRLAMRNLRATFPARSDRELRQTLDECWRHFGREVLLSMQIRNLSLEAIAERCPIDGGVHLEESIARGKGTLIITAHWGGWEVGGLAVMAKIDKTTTVARPLDNELLERDVQQLRAKTGAEVVDRRKAARALLKALSENGVVALLPDQAVQPREGILSPFLGRAAWTTPAPARLALRTGATIVFAFCIPDGLRHRLVFEEPIRVDELGERERSAEALTDRINAVIGHRIAERPELWLWMHDRWKGTGESEATNGV
jgi:lauroyl/myristoyl acyltransferase/tetraacyldisaccharide-1-P 4'-kinase